MNKQIRSVTLAILVLFCLLIAQLTRLQVIDSRKLADDPRNGRVINKNFNSPRGYIQTSDGVLLAESLDVNPKSYNGRFKHRRVYPQGALFGHLTGFYSFTYGNEGLERSYDAELRGRPTGFKNALKPFTDSNYTQNLTTTLDSRIQKVAKEQLGNRRGAAVAINPKDGSVIAMWSFPSYDPNPLSALDQTKVREAWERDTNDPSQPMLPRAYRRAYAPGSTFKTVTAASALEFKPELVDKFYPVERSILVPGSTRPLRNFGNSACGGRMPVLLQISCNTGFASIGLDLGGVNLYNQATRFGFDVPSSKQPLDLPAVASSLFPDPTSFINDSPALAKSAIGQQDVNATPLQMALIAAGVANNGVVMKPHLMKELRDNNGNVVATYGSKKWRTAMTQANAQALKEMMIRVVQAGTGVRAQIPGVTVAGKTGTAQTVPGKAHAWFIGFAPADNPVVAVAVIVESQPGLGDNATGGHVAAPIARAVMEAVLAQKSARTP